MSAPTNRSPMPAILLTGLDEAILQSTISSVVWDLPGVVVLTYVVDIDTQVLIRTISDLNGVIEQNDLDLSECCLHCTIREDVSLTLSRLAQSQKWASCLAKLPATVDARQLCRLSVLHPERFNSVRLASVVAALDHDNLEFDLTCSDYLCNQGLGLDREDTRGIAEVSVDLLEYADAIVLGCSLEQTAAGIDLPTLDHSEIHKAGLAMVQALARPDTLIIDDPAAFDASLLVAGCHDNERTEAWCAAHRSAETRCDEHIWQLELASERPLHPVRIQERIEELGSGPYRSRGCFWLPTRPEALCIWDGTAGQISIGVAGRWESPDANITRLTFTGMHIQGDPRAKLKKIFESCLLTDDELASRGRFWEVWNDGLEPWLGDIRPELSPPP